MNNFFTNLRDNSPLSNRSRGYLPQNAQVKGPKQSMNLSDPVMANLISRYNNTNDWDEKIRVVNAMMENYPNPDESLKNWINRLDRKAVQGKEESDLIDWAVGEFSNPNNANKRDQIVNYLMEYTYTSGKNPSDWYIRSVKNLQDMADKTRKYQTNVFNALNNGGRQ